MRIIAGSARSRIIDAPKGQDTRPTLDRVRETVFDILQSLVPGSRVLDLYAGSGAMALEAVSRGAEHAVMVERDADACRVIRANIDKLDFGGECELYRTDAVKALEEFGRRGETFDLVFLDPPYRYDTAQTLETLARLELVSEEGAVCVEYDTHEPVSDRFEIWRERKIGIVKLRFFRVRRERG